jgi:hypothetical protein
VVEAESGKVDQVRARLADADAFEERTRKLDEQIAIGSLDITKNAVGAYAEFFDRFYDDARRRAQVEEKVKAAWGDLPVFIRIEVLMGLAESALAHADPVKALELVNEAQLYLDEGRWPLQHLLPRQAKLAALRFRAGDADRARADADAALAMFRADGDKIVDIYRAASLCPLAEAYQLMGDTASALVVYRLAVEEGAHNPNSRPRAEDLSATCCSMALSGVEPDAELWSRVRQIGATLGHPW